MQNPFERVRREERARIADFLLAKGKEARERLLAVERSPGERAVAEMTAASFEKLTGIVADMVRLGAMQ